ncbi:MAG: MerR family transcriptional regulator [Ruminiclostridium sp.]|nr:MerR family transcriptional regulator [Ruminiclostridium sp.]
MEYSIQALAKLSGVTTRTLRWYDEIGLLKPSRVAESGYRYYGPAEVDRLQHILFFRALGVELAQVKIHLEDPSLDRLALLRTHLVDLEGEREKLDHIIQSVQENIRAEERKEIMADEKKFEAFKAQMVEENEQKYGKESREKYGDAAVDQAKMTMKNMSQADYQRWTDLDQAILEGLEGAIREGLSPEGPEGETIVSQHKEWLILSGLTYQPNIHRGLGEMYVMDERFTAYYDRNVPGCAQFLRDAIQFWVK